MIHTSKKTIPAREVEDYASCTCDICGAVTECFTSGGDANWIDDSFEYIKTTVKIKVGSSYPGSGSEVSHRFDICSDCFRNKLVPFLQSNGAGELHREERDW